MEYNCFKNDVNIGKLVIPENVIKFPTKWRKPHHSKCSCLEMTSKTKLLPQGENGRKIPF